MEVAWVSVWLSGLVVLQNPAKCDRILVFMSGSIPSWDIMCFDTSVTHSLYPARYLDKRRGSLVAKTAGKKEANSVTKGNLLLKLRAAMAKRVMEKLSLDLLTLDHDCSMVANQS